jgi:RimJ/RimL family protein N-acetyltransferase
MLVPEYPLRTERLLLRAYREDDLDFVYDVQSRPDVARYLYQGVRDREGARESLRQKIAANALRAENDTLTPLILRADTGEPVGDVMLHWLSETHGSGEIGYTIHPDHAGHGYATEAARLMVELGFEELKLHRIIGRIDGRNAASARVLEHLGMRREAYFVQNEWIKGEWTDEAVYAMLADEWRVRR